MKKLASLVLVSLLGACGGDLNDANLDVATLTLTTRLEFDQLKGLFAKQCVDRYGSPEHCTPYPNDLECDVLNVVVKADGRTFAECRVNQVIKKRGFMGLTEGVPFVCKASQDLSCTVCADLYGNNALDTCQNRTSLWRSPDSGWQNNLPDGAGFIPEPGQNPPAVTPPATPPTTTPPTGTTPPEPTAPEPPPAGGGDACDWSRAIDLYAAELNKLLAHDGLNFTWTPDHQKFANPDGTILNGNPNASCKAFASSIKDLLHQCPKKVGGECFYCWDGGSCKTCKCYRINVAALEAACKQIPQSCDAKAQSSWSSAIIMAYGIGTKWLFSPSYKNFYGKVAVPEGEEPKFPKCEGSPLVIDTAGDGIEPTSNVRGVHFDLLGVGAYKTAWVQGDDALLALDRNGNGRIDSGAELFGEATPGGNADGFQALARLDSNGDGVVDERDPQFKELRLWTDANGDGISQPHELTPVLSKGIRSLSVSSRMDPAAIDRHGNDLRLQGSFTRTDGSRGLMIDVYFVGR